MLSADDFTKIPHGNERRIPDIALLDEFYYGQDLSGKPFLNLGDFSHSDQGLSIIY